MFLQGNAWLYHSDSPPIFLEITYMVAASRRKVGIAVNCLPALAGSDISRGLIRAIMKLGGNIRNERTIFEVVWLGGGAEPRR